MKNNVDNDIESIENNADFYYLLEVFWIYKKFIIAVTFTVAVLSVVYVLLATQYFMSKVTMYPITKDQGGPLKEIAASLGIGAKPEGFYLPDVVFSRRIMEKVVLKKYKTENYKDSVNLIQYWEFDKLNLSDTRKIEVSLERLQAASGLHEDKETALISLTIITKECQLSVDIAQAYVDFVTHYLQNELKTQITNSIIFSNNRLIEVKDDLLKKEEELLTFRENNAKLTSPYLSQEHGRMIKEINLVQDVEVLLKKQIELLKIEEVRTKPVMNILDKPVIYEKHVRPKGRNIAMGSTTIAFVLSYLLCLFKEKVQKENILMKLKKSLGIN